MTTTTQAYTAIKTALRDTVSWPGTAPPLIFPNEGKKAGKEFIRVWVEPKRSRQRSQGTKPNRSWHRGGAVMMAIHTELGKGDARALALSEAIKELEGETVSGVIFREHSDGETGEMEGWYFLVVSLTFDYYEHK